MKIVFVSGPYRAKDAHGVHRNIMHARESAIRLWQGGWAVITPHLNTAHFDGLADDSVWLEGDLEMMRRCDAVYFLNTWRESEGAKAEHAEAVKLGLELLYEPGTLEGR